MNWYKTSQAVIGPTDEQSESNIGTPNIRVNPFENLVDEAARELNAEKPGILDNITDINVDLGYGQFGSVSSKLPNTVNINMNNIKSSLATQLGRPFNPSDQDHTNMLKHMIKHVLFFGIIVYIFKCSFSARF